MTITYLISYIFLCAIILGTINYFMMGKPKNEKKRIQKADSNSKNTDESINRNVSVGKILFVLMFGMFIVILDGTVLNVALPKIMADLNVNATTGEWLVTGFMLVNGALIPITAYLIETYGFRKLLLTAMSFFTVGCIIGSLSHSFAMLMIGRVIQACGAGLIMPLGMTIFMTIFPPERRGTAMGIMGISMILAPAIGPTLSGWMVENYDWHVMFIVMSVVGIIDIGFILSWFHLDRELSKPHTDIVGMLFSCIGFACLLYGFSKAGDDGWSNVIVLLSLIAGLILVALFVIRQIRVETPLLNLRVFKSRVYSFAVIINSIVTMSLYGGMLLLPLYLQNIRGFSPVQSGLLLLPGALIMGFMGPISGKIFDKYGARGLAIVGLSITTYATYEFTKLTDSTPYVTILSFYMLRSFGMSLLSMPIMTAGMNSLPMKLIPHGTATTNTIRQIAGSIGTALLITVMTQQTSNYMGDYSNVLSKNNDIMMAQIHETSVALSNSVHISQQASNPLTLQLLVAQATKESMIKGINDAFLFATLISILALILAFFLKNTNVVKKETKEETVS